MEFVTSYQGATSNISEVFEETFARSKSPEEGRLIGGLVQRLIDDTSQADFWPFLAIENGDIVGGCIFSRLTFPEETQAAALLGPVAVATDYQRRGIGQALIRNSFKILMNKGIHVVLVYGDPRYYSRLGFFTGFARRLSTTFDVDLSGRLARASIIG